MKEIQILMITGSERKFWISQIERDNLINTDVSRERLYESATIDNVKCSKSQIAYTVLKKNEGGEGIESKKRKNECLIVSKKKKKQYVRTQK